MSGGRQFAVVLAGFCAFLNLYATQPLLPLLAAHFHAGKVQVSWTLTAANLGVALAAPLAGLVADRWGRRRVIVGSSFLLAAVTLLTATAPSLPVLVGWRFLQGVFTPGVFAATVAYINDEWPPREAGVVVASYVTGTVLGGFASRMIAGVVATHYHWPEAFVALGLLTLGCALALWRGLPAGRGHRAGPAERTWFHAAQAHLRNRKLQAAFAAGFCVLFSLMGTFTWIVFRLAALPFALGETQLASLFAVYLIGAALTPLGGRALARYGHRASIIGATLMGVCGIALTLAPLLWPVALGLALVCTGVFVSQSVASNFLGTATHHDRALAVGIYATFYYLGGGAGAVLPGLLWHLGGWTACAALIAAVQVLTAVIALRFWGSPVVKSP